MPDYREMYYTLFNAVTDALEQLQQLNVGEAKALLCQAQQKTEALYIGTD